MSPTFSLKEEPQKRIGSRDGLVVVVIIVDRKQVPVDICIPHEQVHVWNAMHMLQ